MRTDNTPPTGPGVNLTVQQFNDLVLDPNGRLNKQYGLGYMSQGVAKDLTQDGLKEVIYETQDGRSLILVTNYGAKVQTGTKQQEVTEQQFVGYEDGGYERVLVTPERTETVPHEDCSAREELERELANFRPRKHEDLLYKGILEQKNR